MPPQPTNADHAADARTGVPADERPNARPGNADAEHPVERSTQPPPRRLRLSTILIELGADASPHESPDPPAPPPAPFQARPRGSDAADRAARTNDSRPSGAIGSQPPGPTGVRRSFAFRRLLLARLRPRRKRLRIRSNLTLGEIVERTQHAGFGFLAAFLAMASMPVGGLSVPFGLAVAALGVQMCFNQRHPWLPNWLRRHVVSMRTLDWLSHTLARWTRGLERWVKPRWTFLARGPSWFALGLGIALMGLGLSLPLPIPFSNTIFSIPVMIYAIGLLEDDGVLIAVGHLATVSYIAGAIVFSRELWELVQSGVHWIQGFF